MYRVNHYLSDSREFRPAALSQGKIYAEISECYDGWHFEIKMLEEEAEKMIWFLESIIDMINGEYE